MGQLIRGLYGIILLDGLAFGKKIIIPDTIISWCDVIFFSIFPNSQKKNFFLTSNSPIVKHLPFQSDLLGVGGRDAISLILHSLQGSGPAVPGQPLRVCFQQVQTQRGEAGGGSRLWVCRGLGLHRLPSQEVFPGMTK